MRARCTLRRDGEIIATGEASATQAFPAVESAVAEAAKQFRRRHRTSLRRLAGDVRIELSIIDIPEPPAELTYAALKDRSISRRCHLEGSGKICVLAELASDFARYDCLKGWESSARLGLDAESGPREPVRHPPSCTSSIPAPSGSCNEWARHPRRARGHGQAALLGAARRQAPGWRRTI